LVGVSAILLFISLFLPWFDVSDGIYSGSGSGLDAHGYLYIPLILTILVVLYLVARAGFAKLPFQLPISHELLLRVVTIIDAILVVIGFIFKPSGGYHVNVGWDWGAFVALIVALSPFYWRFVSPFIKAQMAKRSQTSASHTGTTN
jgi:hypothetical protein